MSKEHRLLYTTNEACEALRISRVTLYKLINSKKLTAKKIGRCTYIRADELRAFTEAA